MEKELPDKAAIRTEFDQDEIGPVEIEADGVSGELLGWQIIFTVGDEFTVPVEWVEQRFMDLGLPGHLLPNQITPRRAFVHAGKRVIQQADLDLPNEVDVRTWRNTPEDYLTFHLEVTDRRNDDLDPEGSTIGYFGYDPDSEEVRANMDPEVSKMERGDELSRIYADCAETFQQDFELLKTSYKGEDVRKMIRDRFVKGASTSVRMRDGGAVYFVPAQYGDALRALIEIMEGINSEWKDEGFDAQLEAYEIIDTEEKRAMVAQKVENELENTVEKAMEAAFEELDGDVAAQKAISEAGSELVEAENLAVEHNALLEAELSVKKEIESWKEKVADEEQEKVVEAAMEEVDV